MGRAIVTHGLLLLVAAIWGGHFVALRYLLAELGPTEILLLRGLLASLFYGLFLLANRGRLPAIARQDWPRLVLAGFLGVTLMGFGMIYAQRLIGAGVSSLIVTLNPVFTAILAYLLLRQALTRRQFGGIALAIGGFLIVMLLGAPGARFSASNVAGVLLMACSPLVWSFYTVISKPLLARYAPTYVASYTTIIGAAFLLPFATPHFARGVLALDPRGWLSALFSGVLALAVSYLIWYRGLRVLQPTQVAVYTYLVPVFGILFAALLLGEALTLFTLLGGATILAGVIVTNTGARRALVLEPATSGSASITPEPARELAHH